MYTVILYSKNHEELRTYISENHTISYLIGQISFVIVDNRDTFPEARFGAKRIKVYPNKTKEEIRQELEKNLQYATPKDIDHILRFIKSKILI